MSWRFKLSAHIYSMKILITILLSIFSIVSHKTIAQNFDCKWLFGHGCSAQSEDEGVNIIDFERDILMVNVDEKANRLRLDNTNVSICDSNGELLFYTDGNHLVNKNHEFIENGFGLLKDGECDGNYIQNGAIILPIDMGTGLYMMINSAIESVDFSDKIELVTSNVWYHVLDMNKNDGEGKLVKRKISISETYQNVGEFNVCKHANGKDWWMLRPRFDSNIIDRYYIKNDSIVQFGSQSLDFISYNGFGQTVYSPDGSMMVDINNNHDRDTNYILLFDFDRCTGELSTKYHEQNTESIQPGGAAFSSNSRFLYVSHSHKIFQYDLWEEDIFASKQEIGAFDGFQEWGIADQSFWLMQLAPDGKIYISTPNDGHYLHVIHDPDRRGTACNFEQRGLEFPVQKGITMPNFPNYRLGPIDGSACDTLGLNNHPVAKFKYELIDGSLAVQLTDLSYYEPSNWSWDFGDGESDTGKYPTHEYTSPGTYEICLEVSNDNGQDTFCETVCVVPGTGFQAVIRPISELLNCATSPMTLEFYVEQLENIGPENLAVNWTGPDDFFASTLEIEISQGGWYYVESYLSGISCFIEDSIFIRDDFYIPSASIDSVQQLICDGEFLSLELDPEIDENCFFVRRLFPDGTFIPFGHEKVVTEPGLYRIFVEDCDSVCDTVLFVNVLPSILSTASYEQMDTIFSFSGNSNSGMHLWDFGDGVTSQEENPTHTYETSGTFIVTHIISNECESDTSFFEVMTGVVSSVESEMQQIQIFPNPTEDIIWVKGHAGNSLFKLYNATGVMVHETQLNGEVVEINEQELVAGIYFYEVDGEVGRVVVK